MAKGITETEVHQAADALVGAGERPTVERIRAYLGTGSPNTVTRWLDTWWQGLAARLAAHRARLSLPPAPTAVTELTAQLWEQAMAAAQAQATAALADDRAGLADAQAAIAQREREWQRHLDDHTRRADEAERHLHASQQRLHDLQQLSEHQAAQIHDLTRQRNELKDRGERLEAELARLQVRWDQREAALATEREAQTQHLQGIENRAHAEIDRARQEAKAARAEAAAQVQRLEAELRAGREREETARQALAVAQQEAAAQGARATALEQQWERLGKKRPGVGKTPVSGRRAAGHAPKPPRRARSEG